MIPKKGQIKSFLAFKNFVMFFFIANLVAGEFRFLFSQKPWILIRNELIWIRTTASCLCDHVKSLRC
jgi:hypothetical protein